MVEAVYQHSQALGGLELILHSAFYLPWGLETGSSVPRRKAHLTGRAASISCLGLEMGPSVSLQIHLDIKMGKKKGCLLQGSYHCRSYVLSASCGHVWAGKGQQRCELGDSQGGEFWCATRKEQWGAGSDCF